MMSDDTGCDSGDGRRRNLKQERPLYRPGKGLGGSHKQQTPNAIMNARSDDSALVSRRHNIGSERSDPMLAVEQRLKEMCLQGPSASAARRHQQRYDRNGDRRDRTTAINNKNDDENICRRRHENRNNANSWKPAKDPDRRVSQIGWRCDRQSPPGANPRNREVPMSNGRYLAGSRESLHSLNSVKSNSSRLRRDSTSSQMSGLGPASWSPGIATKVPELDQQNRESDRTLRQRREHGKAQKPNQELHLWRNPPTIEMPENSWTSPSVNGFPRSGPNRDRNNHRRKPPRNSQDEKSHISGGSGSVKDLHGNQMIKGDKLNNDAFEAKPAQESSIFDKMNFCRPVKDWAEEMLAVEQERMQPVEQSSHSQIKHSTCELEELRTDELDSDVKSCMNPSIRESSASPVKETAISAESEMGIPRIDWSECPTPPPLEAEEEQLTKITEVKPCPAQNQIIPSGTSSIQQAPSIHERPPENANPQARVPIRRERYNSELNSGWSHPHQHHQHQHHNGGGVRRNGREQNGTVDNSRFHNDSRGARRQSPKRIHRSPGWDKRFSNTEALPPRFQKQRELQQQRNRSQRQDMSREGDWTHRNRQ